MRPIDCREPPSLGSQYRRPAVTDVLGRWRRTLARWRAVALARSPVHYERYDMRGTYDWRRTLLDVAVTTLLAVWGTRAVVTALLLGPLAAGPRTIVAANLLVSVVGVAASAALAAYRSTTRGGRRGLGRRSGRSPVRERLRRR